LRWIADEPDCADAHYDAALAYEDLEREAEIAIIRANVL
jgi:hypothetical protein